MAGAEILPGDCRSSPQSSVPSPQSEAVVPIFRRMRRALSSTRRGCRAGSYSRGDGMIAANMAASEAESSAADFSKYRREAASTP